MGINDTVLFVYSSYLITFSHLWIARIFSISDYSLDAPISGEALNSITPTFYFSVPMDIAGYELRISDSDDPLVESGNIFNESISSSGYQCNRIQSVFFLFIKI